MMGPPVLEHELFEAAREGDPDAGSTGSRRTSAWTRWRAGPARVLPIDHGGSTDPADHGEPLAEGTWIEPYPDGELDDGYAAP